MADKKNVLILTVDAGFGHRSAANALASAFELNYADRVNVTVYNPLDDKKSPALLRETQNEYDKFVRKMPDFYKINYQISGSTVPSALLESSLTVLLFPVVRSMIKRFKPDVVITTHPFFMAPLNAYITLRKLPIPFLTVITDLTNIHRLWFNQGADFCLLPTEEAYDEAMDGGLTPEMCRVTGIPVKPAFSIETRSKSAIRADLGWMPDVTTALVMGSSRIKNLMSSLHVLNHSGLQLQFILVAGGDEQLYQEFTSTEWHTATRIYNFVDEVPLFMKASDLIIGKPGGLTTTEALACGTPFLLVDVTHGQEDGNASYLINHQAGDLAENPIHALEILFHWLQRDHQLLDQLSRNAAALGKPRSAFAVANLAWEAAEKGRSIPSSRLRSWVPRFRELLRAYNISETADN